jgi:DivIVA domain-containing protein
VHLSPDEIERRTFAIEDRGYDRDEVRVFLREVGAALRLALHTTRPPTTAAADPAPATAATGSTDDFARLGAEVAEVLRSAHDAVDALHHQAALEIAARHEAAEADADEVRRRAEHGAAWTQDRAKRVLITAQEQADAILADAESAAAEHLASARRQAKEHADEVATRTRRHAEQILRAEREALRRLHQAQAGVAAAAEMLSGSETRPIVDLTDLQPSVRLGTINVELADPADATPPSSENDPLVRMIRSAVDRAAEHARDAAGDEPAPPDDVSPEPTDLAAGGPTDGTPTSRSGPHGDGTGHAHQPVTRFAESSPGDGSPASSGNRPIPHDPIRGTDDPRPTSDAAVVPATATSTPASAATGATAPVSPRRTDRPVDPGAGLDPTPAHAAWSAPAATDGRPHAAG